MCLSGLTLAYIFISFVTNSDVMMLFLQVHVFFGNTIFFFLFFSIFFPQRHPFQPGAKVCWERYPNLPVAMYHGHAVALKGMVYTGGGYTQENDNIVVRFDLVSNIWKRISPCPVSYFGLAKFDGKIVAVGGKTAWGISDTVYSYDEENDKWEATIEKMPTARYSPTVFGFRSTLFACGGKDANGISTAIEVYQEESSSWSKCCPLPFACHSMTATVIQGFCYLLGGFGIHNISDKVVYASLQELILKSSKAGPLPRSHCWHRLSRIPQNCGSAANMGGALLSIGGYHTFRIGLPKSYVYSQFQSSWVKVCDLPFDACVGTAVAELPNNELLVMGGATSSNEPRNTVIRGRIIYTI